MSECECNMYDCVIQDSRRRRPCRHHKMNGTHYNATTEDDEKKSV